MTSLRPQSPPDPSTGSADVPAVGEVLAGKFRIERIVGEGAMGLIVEATHLELEQRVALKFLREEARARPEVASRFVREARAAATIANDHVARVHDVGSHQGAPFIVMELLEGEDLERVLQTRGALEPTVAVDYLVQACQGVAAAHVRGIVHRDIKPANLFVSSHGGVVGIKLLDFGISKAGRSGSFDDAALLSGDTTHIMGSPYYMSPEQIRSTRDVDARADIWSLGVVLFELLTSTAPFEAAEVTNVIARVLHEPHERLRALRPDLPAGLEAVIDRCLEKDRDRRFASAAELALALAPFGSKSSRAVAERAAEIVARAAGRASRVDSVPPPSLASPSTTASLPSFVPEVPVSSRVVVAAPARRRTWVALLAVVVGLAGTLFFLSDRLRARPVVPASTAEPPRASADPSAAAPRQVGTGGQAPPSAVAATSADDAGGTAVTTTAAGLSATASAVAAPVRPAAVAPRPRVAPAPRPTNTESEIRHER